jgi:hypothetical protein
MLSVQMNSLVSIEIEVMDDRNELRRFQASNWLPKASILEQMCLIPLQLASEWNLVTLDLQSLCNKVYGSNFACLNRVRIHGTCRIRRIFVSEKFVSESELPAELQAYAPSDTV